MVIISKLSAATDYLGYTGVLLPTGQGCEDPWVLASALAAETEKLKFLVAVRPGLMSPTVARGWHLHLIEFHMGGRLLM